MSKDKISKYLLSSCNKALKQKIENYLFNEEDIEFSKSELNKIKFYNHTLFSELDLFNKNKTLKKSEDSNIIKRLFTLGYTYCPDKLIAELSSCPFSNKTTIYKSLGIDNEFLAKDLEYTFTNINDEEILYSMIEDVNKKFPSFLEYYLSSDNSKKNRYLIAKILKLKYTLETEKNASAVETFILNSLCEIYSSERIKNILNYDFNATELANSLKDTDVINFDEELIHFLKNIYFTLNIENENRKTISGLFEILTFSYSIENLVTEDENEYFNLVNNSKLPFIYKLVYLYRGSEEYNIVTPMRKFILDNHEKALEVLERMLLQNIELGAYILGILINNNFISKDLEINFISKFRTEIETLLETLEETKDRELGVELINTLGYMLTYSDVEEYIATLSKFYENNKWDINEFINMVAHFERLKNNDKNPWEILSKNTSISKKFLISGTIDFVNILSEEQFSKFLKDNEDIFYELLEKKTFIDYTLDEVLRLSYQTDYNFDVTKLLSYLSTSDGFILEEIFDILKDSEKECSEEVEKLSKTKNKRVLANIKALKKVWESNKGKDFSIYSQLENYVFSIYDNYKKDIFYPKSEAYSMVRKKNSDDFVDERVIKLYVALSMNNNNFEDIEIGKTIREFVNIDDLNKCLDSLFTTWVKDNSPVHTSSIVRTYLLTADDYGMDKIFDFLEDIITKPKLELTRSLLSLFFTIKREEFNNELKFIKADIHHNELGRTLSLVEQKNFNTTTLLLSSNMSFSMNFDKNGEKFLNFGKRKIKLALNKELELTIFNQDNKEVKSLPKYSAKFEDDEDRVSFYQKEIKRFKKKKEFLLYEIKKYMFYNMIGERIWSLESWKNEIESSYFTKVIAENILWVATFKNIEYYCYYDGEKFIDIKSGEPLSNIENIKIFYSGEIEENLENINKNFKAFLPQQFNIFKTSTINIKKFIGLSLTMKKINSLLNDYFAEMYSPEFNEDKLILVDKINRNFVEISFSLFSKSRAIKEIKINSIFEDNIEAEKLNSRFLNFIYFVLEEITTLDM